MLLSALNEAGAAKLPIVIDSPGGAVEPALAMGRLIRSRGLAVAVAGTIMEDCPPQDRACANSRGSGVRSARMSKAPAICASACVLVLASGTTRFVGQGALVGVHQMFNLQTFTKVLNIFRIRRRLIDGQPVEIGRTLVKTTPISSQTVIGKAPEMLYTEVAVFLSKMGVGPDLVPLMRATPPSGVHWMTPNEIASTRIATDTGLEPAWVASAWAPTSVRESAAEWIGKCCGRPVRTPAGSGAALAAPPAPRLGPDGRTVEGAVTLAVQHDGSASTFERGTTTWSLPVTPETIDDPGLVPVTAEATIPAAELRLTLRAKASRRDEPGDVMLDLTFVSSDASLFGPVVSLTVPPVRVPGSRVWLVAEKTERLGAGSYRVVLSLPRPGWIGSEFRMELGDAAGRHVTLQLPIPDPVNTLFGAGRA